MHAYSNVPAIYVLAIKSNGIAAVRSVMVDHGRTGRTGRTEPCFCAWMISQEVAGYPKVSLDILGYPTVSWDLLDWTIARL